MAQARPKPSAGSSRSKSEKSREPSATGTTVTPMPATVEPPAPPLPVLPPALQRVARKEGDAARGQTSSHLFDKAFPVFISSERGVVNGVGRNITAEGMFIETRDPCPLGSEIRVTFEGPALGAEITAVALVRFQAFLNYAGSDGDTAGLRGIGVRFVSFDQNDRQRSASTRH